jgi:hypothetical protein
MAGSDMVRYSDKITRPEAEALARYLKQSGFFQDHGVTVELSRRADGAFVSFSVKDGFWDNAEYIDSIELLGAEIASAAVNPPLTIELLDPKGVSRRQVRITRRVVHVGKNDLVYYQGSATGEDAKALGKALQENGFFADTGRAIDLSKGAEGTVITLNINAAAWGNPQYQKSAIEFGRQIAPAVGGLPITLRLVKPLTLVEKVASVKPETVDLPIR